MEHICRTINYFWDLLNFSSQYLAHIIINFQKRKIRSERVNIRIARIFIDAGALFSKYV